MSVDSDHASGRDRIAPIDCYHIDDSDILLLLQESQWCGRRQGSHRTALVHNRPTVAGLEPKRERGTPCRKPSSRFFTNRACFTAARLHRTCQRFRQGGLRSTCRAGASRPCRLLDGHGTRTSDLAQVADTVARRHQRPFYRVRGWRDQRLWNCLDRHLDTQPDKLALIFEADDGR